MQVWMRYFILEMTNARDAAGEIKQNYLPAKCGPSMITFSQKGREMWIWGDRLLDGKTTGLGEWEASFNNTYRAIDMIPKDVVICDWHYDRADKTAIYFAMKGFRVMTCPWRQPSTAITQINDMIASGRNQPLK